MYLYDAQIVSADSAALVQGRFSFHPDLDSETTFAIPETDFLAVEINERVMHVRPVSRAMQREDGFFDVDETGTSFSSEQVTSHVLGDRTSPGFVCALEAVWTGRAGTLRGACQSSSDRPPERATTSLKHLTLRSRLTDVGLQVWLAGEIGGAIFVGNAPPKVFPKGRIEIEFVLSWAWIAVRGWSLLWEMRKAPDQGVQTHNISSADSRHFYSIALCSNGARPLLVGAMDLHGRDAIGNIAPDACCSHLVTYIDPTSITVQRASQPRRLANGMFAVSTHAPFVQLSVLGLAAIFGTLSESDEGYIEATGTSLGTVTHESDEDKETSQPIVALCVSIQRSVEGIHLHIENTLGTLKVRAFGKMVESAQQAGTPELAGATKISVDVLLPTALLIARDLLPRFLRARRLA
jgi:hypothetical protein